MKPAAQLILHSTLSHLAQSSRYHLERVRLALTRVVTQQEIEDARAGKLGRAPESPEPVFEGRIYFEMWWRL